MITTGDNLPSQAMPPRLNGTTDPVERRRYASLRVFTAIRKRSVDPVMAYVFDTVNPPNVSTLLYALSISGPGRPDQHHSHRTAADKIHGMLLRALILKMGIDHPLAIEPGPSKPARPTTSVHVMSEHVTVVTASREPPPGGNVVT